MLRGTLTALLFAANGLSAQTHLSKVQALRLDSIVTPHVVTYFSAGRESRARDLTTALAGMIDYYSTTRGWHLAPKLAVLTEPDWRATLENPYGIPAMRQPGPLAFMPADVGVGAAYQLFMNIGNRLSSGARAQITANCGSLERCASDGADGIVFHELAHMYQAPAGIGSPAYWFNEFVADYIMYSYLRANNPSQTYAFMAINELARFAPPQFESLDAFEQNIEQSLPEEGGRLHAVFLEQIVAVHAVRGAAFIDELARAFPIDRYPFTCFEAPPPAVDGAPPMSRSWTGLCPGSIVPTAEILQRLESIEPGFLAWAARFGEPRPFR